LDLYKNLDPGTLSPFVLSLLASIGHWQVVCGRLRKFY